MKSTIIKYTPDRLQIHATDINQYSIIHVSHRYRRTFALRERIKFTGPKLSTTVPRRTILVGCHRYHIRLTDKKLTNANSTSSSTPDSDTHIV